MLFKSERWHHRNTCEYATVQEGNFSCLSLSPRITKIHLLTNLLCLLSVIRQDVAGALQQVVSEEEPSEWVLHTSTHLYQVLQNVFTRLGEGAHIHHTHGDEQISVDRRKEKVGLNSCIIFSFVVAGLGILHQCFNTKTEFKKSWPHNSGDTHNLGMMFPAYWTSS